MNPLLSCRIKIERAKKHLKDLQGQVELFNLRHPYQSITDDDSEPGIRVQRLKIIEDISPDLSAYVGDTIHNLRSAMDSLAFVLVSRNGPVSDAVIQETYFPVHWNQADLTKPESRTSRFFSRVGPEIETLIKGIEPYRGGKGDALFRIDRLDIIDKHRAILPVGGALAGIGYIATGQNAPITGRAFDAPPPFPLKNGDELARTAFFQPEYQANANFIFEVAFNEIEIVQRDPIIPTLYNFIVFVEGTIDIFARNIFKTSW